MAKRAYQPAGCDGRCSGRQLSVSGPLAPMLGVLRADHPWRKGPHSILQSVALCSADDNRLGWLEVVAKRTLCALAGPLMA
jgi:hypothetical protein